MKFKRKVYKKRTYRKRKAYKKARRSGVRWDGPIYLKCNLIENVLMGVDHADYVVQWGSDTVVAGSGRIKESAEFQQYSQLYREYKIVGVKMRFIPNLSNSTGIIAQTCHVGSIVSVLPSAATADNEMLEMSDFKIHRGNAQVFKYVRCGKYFASKNQKWIDSSDEYELAGTLFRIYANGFSLDAMVGRMMTTWYVTLRCPT